MAEADGAAGEALRALGRRLQGPTDLGEAAATLPGEVLALNDAARAVADARLSFWSEPAQFARLLRDAAGRER